MESTATHLAVTFLRTHPAFGYFPGQTALVEMAPARVLIADGFAEEASPASAPANPAPVADSYAAPAFAGYEQAVMPAAAPTALPAEFAADSPADSPTDSEGAE